MTQPYYPNLDGKVPYDVAQGIRTAYQYIHELRAEVEALKNSGYVTRDQAFTHLGPHAMRKQLQVTGGAPLNVTGLTGQLAQPQIADAPTVTVLPPITDPLSQDGTLVSLSDRVYRFDGTTDPGTWVPITAGPAPSTAVTSLDSITGAVTLVGSTAITITDNSPVAGDISIASPTFVASGASHAAGSVPDPGAVAGTTKFLREDATWQVPSGGGGGGLVGYITPATLTPPVAARFTWVNQGTVTTTTNSGGALWMAQASAPGTDSIALLEASVPATPYSAIVGFVMDMYYSNNTIVPGLYLRESSTGKLIQHSLDVFNGATRLVLEKWNSPTSFSAAYISDGSWNITLPIQWLKVTDDGTNLTFYTGPDGQNWVQQYQVARTNWLATGPDQAGFGFDALRNGGVLFLHWSLA